MDTVYSLPLTPSYKNMNGVSVLHAPDTPLPDNFNRNEPSFVQLPAGQFGGNHSHPRQEAFFCYQQGVELHWIDRQGKKHTDTFINQDGAALLWVIPPHIPHAVVNTSDSTATLIEYADGPQVDVQTERVVD